ncbi:MAG TPA: D-ribose pyranase [Anaeromyxobacter sp.]|nr:D-ribose pyranase [Anaeromyxobacter sp.]
MKRGTILHPALARVVASLGHGDLVVIADAGLPVPSGPERIDLAFAPGKPGFLEVLDAVLSEMEVERAALASEIETVPPAPFLAAVRGRLLALPKVAKGGIELVPHEELKRRTAGARAVVRTGEFTPYANVLLSSGVVF